MIKKTALKIAFIIILLTAINSCYYERESNDELEICFIRNNNIWTMNIDGTNQKQITFTNNNYAPSWSPDGKRILFSNDSTTKNIYIINSDGTNLKKITNSIAPNFSSSATWSANGEKIYYYEDNSSIYSIVEAKPDRTIIQRYNIGGIANALSPSPDGKYIYYLKNSDSYRLDLATGEEDQFTATVLEHCSISPDGSKIAHKLGSNDTYIYNINNNITDLLISQATYPCWTPDGKKIVYVSSSGNIFIINIDGSEKKPLTSSGGCSYPCVKWKPK